MKIELLRYARILTAGLFAGLVATLNAEAAPIDPYAHAVRAEEPPVLDGRLDDLCWTLPIENMVQQSPDVGAEPGFPATVYVAYDAQTLYVGFEIHSGSPDDLVATVLQRDGPILGSDDFFAITLDTFHDHRDAYYFITNPIGARQDGRIGDEGVNIDGNWDGTWRVKTVRTADGWSGELAIPLADLRFSETADGIWGFGAFVNAKKRQESLTWPEIGKSGTKVSRYGDLKGMTGLDGRQPLVFQPFVTQGSQFGRYYENDSATWQPKANTWERDLGVDLRYSPTSALRLNLAVNPDFATVEADQFLFNLTTDELFLAERRPFFTESMDIFQTPSRLLYTRRIGLGSEQMISGLKMMGKTGANSFGVMNVLTGAGAGPEHNYTALRLKRDVFGSSTFGVLAIGKESISANSTGFNRAVGADFNYKINQRLKLIANINGSQGGASDAATGYDASLSLRYQGQLLNGQDNLYWQTDLEDVSPGFNLENIGFVPGTRIDRRGAQTQFVYGYSINDSRLNHIKLEQQAWYFQDHSGAFGVQDGLSSKLTLTSKNRIQPSLLVSRSLFYFADDQERHHNTQQTLEVKFGPYPRFGGKLSYRRGDNFSNAIRFSTAELSFKSTRRTTWTANVFHLNSKPFDATEAATTNLIGMLGFDFLITPEAYWRIVFQGDTDAERVLVNSLLRYEFQPGSAFYLSYKETRDESPDGFLPSDRLLLAKLSYLMNI